MSALPQWALYWEPRGQTHPTNVRMEGAGGEDLGRAKGTLSTHPGGHSGLQAHRRIPAQPVRPEHKGSNAKVTSLHSVLRQHEDLTETCVLEKNTETSHFLTD